jgi:CII-binding regulator of phage lambda lysogenization HflD
MKMKFLIKFDRYLFEQTNADPNVNMETNTAINYDNMVKEYNSKKSLISTFFESPKITDIDIQKQLKMYTNEKGVFENDLLRMWWELCNLTRQIKTKENQINNVEKDVDKQENKLNTSDTEIKPKIQQIVSNMKNISTNYANDVQNLKEKIKKLGDDIEKKLSDYKSQSKNIKRKLDQNKI